MLGHYQISIAALSETRAVDKTQVEEVGGGYTFYCLGKPEDDRITSGVGLVFAQPWQENLRVCLGASVTVSMTLHIRIAKDQYADTRKPGCTPAPNSGTS